MTRYRLWKNPLSGNWLAAPIRPNGGRKAMLSARSLDDAMNQLAHRLRRQAAKRNPAYIEERGGYDR